MISVEEMGRDQVAVADVAQLERLTEECQILTSFLIARGAPADVAAAYVRAHEVSPVAARGTASALDRALLRIANLGPRFARAADAYAAVFARNALLRRKLVLLVAILE